MNAHFVSAPTPEQSALAPTVSGHALRLIGDYGREIADSMEWPNRDNVNNALAKLQAYIAQLEQKR